MPLLLPASFVFASDNTTSANADLRPRLSTGLGSCFFLIFSVFARRYNSSALTSRWGCGDGYPLKTRSSAETHLFGIPAVHCTGSSLRTVSEQSPLSPSVFANCNSFHIFVYHADGVMISLQSPLPAERWMYPLETSCLMCLLTAATFTPASSDNLAMVMSGLAYIRLRILLVVFVRNVTRSPSNHQTFSPRSVRKRILNDTSSTNRFVK